MKILATRQLKHMNDSYPKSRSSSLEDAIGPMDGLISIHKNHKIPKPDFLPGKKKSPLSIKSSKTKELIFLLLRGLD